MRQPVLESLKRVVYIPVAGGEGGRERGDPGKFEGGCRGVFKRVHHDAGNGRGGGAIPLPARWIRLPILHPTSPVTAWLSVPALITG